MAAIVEVLNKFVALVKMVFDVLGMGKIFEQLTNLI